MKRLIDPKERKILRTRIEELEIVDLEEIKEIVLPYIELDYERALDQAAHKVAKNIIASIRDDKGVRKFYSTKESEFVNIESTTDIRALQAVENQLSIKVKGLNRAKNKVTKERKRVIKGQMDIFSEAVI